MTAPASPVLSVPDAAAYIGVSKKTMQRMVAALDIAVVAVTQQRRVIRQSVLDEYLARRDVPARRSVRT